MKKQLFLLFLLVSSSLVLLAQESIVPKNIAEAITFLQTDCPDSLKLQIRETEDRKLVDLCYPEKREGYKTVYNWIRGDDGKKSKIKKYLNRKGVLEDEFQIDLLLVALKRTLLNEPFDENTLIYEYKIIQLEWEKKMKARLVADTLYGVYIPKDLKDCIKQIDLSLDDSTKNMIKQWTEDDFSVYCHFGIGLNLRNYWGLWGGSRLSKYFREMEIYHPDDMSAIIIKSYYRHLTGEKIQLWKQVWYYKFFWLKQNLLF